MKKKTLCVTVVPNASNCESLFVYICMYVYKSQHSCNWGSSRAATSAWLPNCMFGNGNWRHLNRSDSTTVLSNPAAHVVQSHHDTRIVVWLAFTPTQ